MILTTADYARAEDGYLRESEPDTRCDGCGHSPCSCDQEYELLMDELDWRDAS